MVGTKTDLRDDACFKSELAKRRIRPVEQDAGTKVAKKLGAVKYMQCSAVTQFNIREIFNEVN